MIKNPKSRFIKDRAFKLWKKRGGTMSASAEQGCKVNINGVGEVVLVEGMSPEMKQFMKEQEFKKRSNDGENGFVIVK